MTTIKHSRQHLRRILMILYFVQSDVRYIPVTVEGGDHPVDRGQVRQKRPSTSEPASPVPSKRAQDESGEPRRRPSQVTKDELGAGEAPEKMTNTPNETYLHSSNTSSGDIITELEISGDITDNKDRGISSQPHETQGRKSRRNSKYEEAHEVVLPVKIDDTIESNCARDRKSKDTSKETVIKIHREGYDKKAGQVNKENQEPNNRTRNKYINVIDKPEENNNTYVQGSNGKLTDKGIPITTLSHDVKLKHMQRPMEECNGPKTYYFGESQTLGSHIKIANVNGIQLSRQNEESFLTNNDFGKCAETNDLNGFAAKSSARKSVDIPISFNRATMVSEPSAEENTSRSPLTAHGRHTADKTPNCPPHRGSADRPQPGPEDPTVGNSSIQTLKKKPDDICTQPPAVAPRHIVVPSSNIHLVRADDPQISVNNSQKGTDQSLENGIADEDIHAPKKSTGQTSPPSPMLEKAVKVEQDSCLLEDDLFQHCWREYSNTLQDVLSRLHELSTELGKTPKFLSSCPPGSDVPQSATPSARPAYYFLPTPEVRACIYCNNFVHTIKYN